MQAFRENQQPSNTAATSRLNRAVELPRDMEQVLTFFTSRAPARLPAPERWPEVSESPVQFARSGLTGPNMPATPGVSNVQLVDFDGDKRIEGLATTAKGDSSSVTPRRQQRVGLRGYPESRTRQADRRRS